MFSRLFSQPSVARKRVAFWVKLCTISMLLHALFLVWLFFVFQDNRFNLALNVSVRRNQGAPVVLVPPTLLITQVKRAAVQAPAKQKPQKKQVAMAQPKKEQIKKAEVKKTPPKSQPKPEPKTVVQQKKEIAPAKKPEPKKTVQKNVPKSVEKKVDTVAKNTPKKIEEKLKEQQEVAAQPQELVQPNGPLFFTAFENELGQKWKPPLGLSDDCECEIGIRVSWEGNVNRVDVVKSSGVLVYDVAARAALEDAALPRWTWGKSITITFKQ